MSIRYYFSGFDEVKGFPEELLKFLKNDISSTKKMVFIPTDFSLKEKIVIKSNGLITTFNKAGFVFDNIIVLNENMSSKEMREYIEKSDVVFLMGGNPSTQLDIINSNDLEVSIRKTKAVVMGMSAGAMCMSDYSFLLPVNEKYPKMDIRKGMNLSGISIYPHYNSDGKVPEVLDTGYEKTKKSDLLYANQNYGPIYLLSDNSEIRAQDGQLIFIGQNIIYLSNGNFELVDFNSK